MSDYQPFEENEISAKANGGTELIKRKIASLVDPQLSREFQVICSRVRTLRDDKIRVYWVHDLPVDPETAHLADSSSRERFHKIVFCGNWQKDQYISHLKVPMDDKVLVIENGIEPLPLHTKPTGETNLVYVASPQRGLAILVPVFEKLVEKFPAIKLHVFSSFNIYGWGETDEHPNFKALFEACKSHPNIVYHGTQPNSVVRDQLMKSHILAYPSIWEECNSIGTMEAMSAGLLCVHPNYAGLSDTAGGLNAMYQYHADMRIHAQRFYENMVHAIQIVHDKETQNYLNFVKAYADCRFHIDKVKMQWEDLLKELLAKYPNVEDRKVPILQQKTAYRPFG